MRLSKISICLKNINIDGSFQAHTANFFIFLKNLEERNEGLERLRSGTFVYNEVSDDLQKGCHEAIQIYALVEADAERQVKKRPNSTFN